MPRRTNRGGLPEAEVGVVRGPGWTVRASERYERVEDRLVPSFIEVEIDGNDTQPTSFARVEIHDGVPQCVEIRLVSRSGQREVRQSDLRSIEVRAVVEDLVAGFAFKVTADAERGDAVDVPYSDSPSYADALQSMMRARSGRSKRSISPELLARVATIYRANVDKHPTKAVREAFGVSERMASEYVAQARRKKLLPPTTPGKKNA